jgi:hypothetical protein
MLFQRSKHLTWRLPTSSDPHTPRHLQDRLPSSPLVAPSPRTLEVIHTCRCQNSDSIVLNFQAVGPRLPLFQPSAMQSLGNHMKYDRKTSLKEPINPWQKTKRLTPYSDPSVTPRSRRHPKGVGGKHHTAINGNSDELTP